MAELKESEILQEIKEALPNASERIKGEFLGAARTLNELHRAKKEKEARENAADQSGLKDVCN